MKIGTVALNVALVTLTVANRVLPSFTEFCNLMLLPGENPVALPEADPAAGIGSGAARPDHRRIATPDDAGTGGGGGGGGGGSCGGGVGRCRRQRRRRRRPLGR